MVMSKFFTCKPDDTKQCHSLHGVRIYSCVIFKIKSVLELINYLFVIRDKSRSHKPNVGMRKSLYTFLF